MKCHVDKQIAGSYRICNMDKSHKFIKKEKNNKFLYL